MPLRNKKPIIAVLGMTCCEGCRVAVVDLGERFLKLAEQVIVGDFPFIQERAKKKYFDLTFVEGTPILPSQIEEIKEIRRRSKVLVPIGSCACLGGIQEIKNYRGDKESCLQYVYKNVDQIANPDIKPISAYVPVDFELTGCPINKDELFEFTKKILVGDIYKIPQRPVCYECQLKQNECLLQKGLPCIGPIILGGCDAPCPSVGYPCDGCRGPMQKTGKNFDNLKKILNNQGYNEREIEMITERFGGRDQLEDKLKPQNTNENKN